VYDPAACHAPVMCPVMCCACHSFPSPLSHSPAYLVYQPNSIGSQAFCMVLV
jgi:hypothetical protein